MRRQFQDTVLMGPVMNFTSQVVEFNYRWQQGAEERCLKVFKRKAKIKFSKKIIYSTSYTCI